MNKTINVDDKSIAQFTSRKQDHIRLAMLSKNEARGENGLEKIVLQHAALPEINFDATNLASKTCGWQLAKPFLVSSMTAGHNNALTVNYTLMQACIECGWLMGVGSQRRQLFDKDAAQEWQALRKSASDAKLLANIGLSQVINTPIDDIQRLIDSIQAIGLIIHCNPLQEIIQPEGTPNFAGGLQAITELCNAVDLPVIIKETGCGFSEQSLLQLNNTGVAAVDISGYGGTHWGRIEGDRAKDSIRKRAAATFSHWGISTADSLRSAQQLQHHNKLNYDIWASGGLRTGLDAAKCFALNARLAGFAKPMLLAALEGVEAVITSMQAIEFECRTAIFCTGSKQLTDLQEKYQWR